MATALVVGAFPEADNRKWRTLGTHRLRDPSRFCKGFRDGFRDGRDLGGQCGEQDGKVLDADDLAELALRHKQPRADPPFDLVTLLLALHVAGDSPHNRERRFDHERTARRPPQLRRNAQFCGPSASPPRILPWGTQNGCASHQFREKSLLAGRPTCAC